MKSYDCQITEDICTAPWQSFTSTISFPQYPGCDVNVLFEQRNCNNSWTEMRLSGIVFLNSTLCSDLIDDIFPFGWSGGINETVAMQIWQEAYDIVGRILFQEMYDNAGNLQYLLECDAPNSEGWGEFHFIDGACRALCLNYTPGASTGMDGEYNLQFNHCTDACCGYITRYCYDTANDEIIKTTLGPWYVNGNDTTPCDESIPPACPTTGSSTWSLPCQVYCTPPTGGE